MILRRKAVGKQVAAGHFFFLFIYGLTDHRGATPRGPVGTE